jgi:hypothetical protein
MRPPRIIPEIVGRRIRQLRSSGIGLRRSAEIIASEFGPQHKYSHTHIGEYLKSRLPTLAATSAPYAAVRKMPTQVDLASTLKVRPDIPTSSSLHPLQLVNPLPTNPFTSTLTPQEPFSGMNDDEFNLLGSSITVQPPKLVDPISRFMAAMHSKFNEKLYSRIDSMADTATNNIFGIRNTQLSNLNLEDSVPNATPSESISREKRMQSLVDEVKSIKEARAKESEKQRQDTEKKLLSIQEEINEQMRKDFAPKTTDLSKVGEHTSAHIGQHDQLESVKVLDAKGTEAELPGGTLTQLPKTEPSPLPVDATVSVNLNGEMPLTALPLVRAEDPVVNSMSSMLAAPATNDVIIPKELGHTDSKPIQFIGSSTDTLVDQSSGAAKPVDSPVLIEPTSAIPPAPDESADASNAMATKSEMTANPSKIQNNSGTDWWDYWWFILLAIGGGVLGYRLVYRNRKKTQTQTLPNLAASADGQGYARVNDPKGTAIF